MSVFLDYKDIPVVVIGNFAEAHVDFLGRCSDSSERSALVWGEAYHADRILLWAGDPKMVIVSFPIVHAEFIRHHLKYPHTEHLAPESPTYHLCKDILRESHLIEAILAYAGDAKRIQLIPYATTPEFYSLQSALHSQFGLEVLTPESPAPNDFWLRDYIDTKNGFRVLASQWLQNADDLLPLGVSCYNIEKAIQVADWFSRRGESCVVKADTGESGIGTFVIDGTANGLAPEIVEHLSSDPYFSTELIVVEEYIPAKEQISPSLEIRVPKLGVGEPHITYVSRQLFLKFGDFCGIQLDKSLYQTPWYPALESSGLQLAKRLQQMGYVGHFDMDCIVRDDGRLYLLEINARRTGGTHVHDFARHFFGEDYIEKASFISYEAMDAGTITDPTELLEILKEFLFPMNDEKNYGLVITITRALQDGRFGCIAVAPTADLALKLQQDVLAHIRKVSTLIP